MADRAQRYEYSVFINCPFDDTYKPLFEAIVFAVHDCGYLARCSLEAMDAGQVRFEKIVEIISECKFGIHDISRTEADHTTSLPRFNMPFELGLFIGARRFGSARHQVKTSLILDVERYRYQKFLSDIAGQDIVAHSGEPVRAISAIRDWLSAAAPKTVRIPGGRTVIERYATFREELPATCRTLRLRVEELTFNDYVLQVEEWLKANVQTAG